MYRISIEMLRPDIQKYINQNRERIADYLEVIMGKKPESTTDEEPNAPVRSIWEARSRLKKDISRICGFDAPAGKYDIKMYEKAMSYIDNLLEA